METIIRILTGAGVFTLVALVIYGLNKFAKFYIEWCSVVVDYCLEKINIDVKCFTKTNIGLDQLISNVIKEHDIKKKLAKKQRALNKQKAEEEEKNQINLQKLREHKENVDRYGEVVKFEQMRKAFKQAKKDCDQEKEKRLRIEAEELLKKEEQAKINAELLHQSKINELGEMLLELERQRINKIQSDAQLIENDRLEQQRLAEEAEVKKEQELLEFDKKLKELAEYKQKYSLQ